jgi:hypothetical protein
MVHWGESWWRAEVLKTEQHQSLIRYVGYGQEWDEWVGPDRLKVYSEEDAAKMTLEGSDNQPSIQGSPAKGDLLVEWGKQWWPAEVLRQENGQYFIHYKGYGSNWDQWVPMERMATYSGEATQQ